MTLVDVPSNNKVSIEILQLLLGEEINEQEATVHRELANNHFDDFRRTFSDHFPVTTCVNLGPDND